MKYCVDQVVFDKNEDICFGIIIGTGMKNMVSQEEDVEKIQEAVKSVQSQIKPEDLKTFPQIAVYRDAMRNVGINPNKFKHSVEAMCKRVVKAGSVPNINAIVDLTNVIALTELVTLGAHDLEDIKDDLAVRFSTEDDRFLPIGKTDHVQMPDGELVFISGNDVQTRQWLWRQSDRGKITLDSTNIVFQIVGFKNEYYSNFKNAMRIVESSIVDRFDGAVQVFEVDKNNRSIEFKEK